MKHISAILISSLVFVYTYTTAQHGGLDNTFGTDGKVITGITSDVDIGRSIAIQPDGKIIVAGHSGLIENKGPADFAVVRYHPNGSPDNSFGSNSIVNTDFGDGDQAYSVVLQPDGKIIVAGRAEGLAGLFVFALARYNADGTPDNSFGSNGKVPGPLGQGRSMVLQPDGKILVAGISISGFSFAVARYNVDGTFDNSFGTDGLVITDGGGANSITLQADGKIVVAGWAKTGLDEDFRVVRYNADGSLDNSFGGGSGITTTNFDNMDDRAESVLIQPDGKIITSGHSWFEPNDFSSVFALARYNIDGTLDGSFGLQGKVITDIVGVKDMGLSSVLQPDGKIVVAGRTRNSEHANVVLVRYNVDGTPDNSFDTDGIVTTDFGGSSAAYGCAIQANGRIVVAGIVYSNETEGNFALARYLSGLTFGIVDFSIRENSLVVYPNPLQEAAVLEYTLTKVETLSIDLYDISGSLVKSFVRSEKRSKGTHKETLIFNPSVPSGTYILTLSNGKGSSSVQVVK